MGEDAFDKVVRPIESIGLKADLPQRWQILEQPADAEVARVIDGGFGAQGRPLPLILLNSAAFVVGLGLAAANSSLRC